MPDPGEASGRAPPSGPGCQVAEGEAAQPDIVRKAVRGCGSNAGDVTTWPPPSLFKIVREGEPCRRRLADVSSGRQAIPARWLSAQGATAPLTPGEREALLSVQFTDHYYCG